MRTQTTVSKAFKRLEKAMIINAHRFSVAPMMDWTDCA